MTEKIAGIFAIKLIWKRKKNFSDQPNQNLKNIANIILQS